MMILLFLPALAASLAEDVLLDMVGDDGEVGGWWMVEEYGIGDGSQGVGEAACEEIATKPDVSV